MVAIGSEDLISTISDNLGLDGRDIDSNNKNNDNIHPKSKTTR